MLRCARKLHRVRLGLWILVLALQMSAAYAEGLTYRIEGIGRTLRENVSAYLGDAPADPASAERFLVTAPERVRSALEALGYYDSVVELDVDKDVTPWEAAFFVEVNEPLRYTAVDVALSGPGQDDEALQRLVARNAPRKGDVVHHGRYEAFRDDLQQLARQRGFFDAELETHAVQIDVGARAAEMSLHLATGTRYRFGELRVEDALLDDEFLQSLRAFEVGDPYTQDGILRLRQRLLRLGFFSSVVVVPEVPERRDGDVPVRVDVVRAPRHSYELGVGFSTDTRQRVSLLWRTPRLNRFGHSQQTSARWSPINPEFRITYSMPQNDPARDLLQVIALLEDNEFGDLDSQQRELGLRRELTTRRGVLSGGVRFLNEEWEALDESFASNFLLATLTFSQRRRGEVAVDPESGFSQFYALEMGGDELGSDEDLVRAYGQWVGVRRFRDAWRVVARAEAGMLFSSSERPDEIPPSLSFFAGGDNSIRGYGYQSIGREISTIEVLRDGLEPEDPRRLTVGGNRLLTASIELQRYLTPAWRVALFADGGDAFVDDDFEMNLGLGAGVHYLSPVGALRFEVASPVTAEPSDWRIHINIGAEF